MGAQEPKTPVFKSFSGDLLCLVAAAPLPPGSRVAFSLTVAAEPEPLAVQGKVIYAKPAEAAPGRYDMSIRVHSLTKAVRDALLAATGAP